MALLLSGPLMAQTAEPANPLPADPAAWQQVTAGLQVGFGSVDVRYRQQEPPATTAATWQVQAWRGERVHTQVVVWSTQAHGQVSVQATAPANAAGQTLKVTTGLVRYVLADGLNADGGGCGERPPGRFPAHLEPDLIDTTTQTLLAARSTRPFWVSVTVPAEAASGRYTGTLTVGGSGGPARRLPFSVEVLPHTLPPPRQWAFHLDLWQSPYAIARVHKVEVWSGAHFAAMRPYMQHLADAGQKTVTATLIHDPWRSQTEDVYGSMIGWRKKRDGSWAYDYRVFDRWVSFMDSLGISKRINCYSLIPWDLKFRYYDEAAGRDTLLVAAPGTAAYAAYWEPMLRDFARHLKQKGWFEKTALAMDERPLAAMQQALRVIRRADPAFQVSLAGLYHPELKDELYDYCVVIGQPISAEVIAQRRQRGQITTVYTACDPGRPNTFSFSPPAEAAWLGWHTAAEGFDGYLRWAYNSWPADPLRDSRFRTWASGDTYFVYPGPLTSIRFERLREGIQDAEKIRILREKLTAKNRPADLRRLEKAVAAFRYGALGHTPAAAMLNPARQVLNSF